MPVTLWHFWLGVHRVEDFDFMVDDRASYVYSDPAASDGVSSRTLAGISPRSLGMAAARDPALACAGKNA